MKIARRFSWKVTAEARTAPGTVRFQSQCKSGGGGTGKSGGGGGNSSKSSGGRCKS